MNKQIKEILEDVIHWDTCPENYKETIKRYLASEESGLAIHGVNGFYYLKNGEFVKNGDEYLRTEDGTWNTIDDADTEYEFEEDSMYVTRRKL